MIHTCIYIILTRFIEENKCNDFIEVSCSSNIILIFVSFPHQIKMESTLENGWRRTTHRHTPQSKGEEEAKSTTSGESTQRLCSSGWATRNIKKQQISQPFISKTTHARKELVEKGDSECVTVVLTRISLGCQGWSSLHCEITNAVFIIVSAISIKRLSLSYGCYFWI